MHRSFTPTLAFKPSARRASRTAFLNTCGPVQDLRCNISSLAVTPCLHLSTRSIARHSERAAADSDNMPAQARPVTLTGQLSFAPLTTQKQTHSWNADLCRSAGERRPRLEKARILVSSSHYIRSVDVALGCKRTNVHLCRVLAAVATDPINAENSTSPFRTSSCIQCDCIAVRPVMLESWRARSRMTVTLSLTGAFELRGRLEASRCWPCTMLARRSEAL